MSSDRPDTHETRDRPNPSGEPVPTPDATPGQDGWRINSVTPWPDRTHATLGLLTEAVRQLEICLWGRDANTWQREKLHEVRRVLQDLANAAVQQSLATLQRAQEALQADNARLQAQLTESQQANEWREVVREMPDPCVTVLTQHVDDLFPVPAFYLTDKDGTVCWMLEREGPEDTFDGREGKCGPLYRAPTHWMPLPSSPVATLPSPAASQEQP